MRNLKIVGSATWKHHELPFAAATWDSTRGSLICAFGPSREDPIITLQRWKSPRTKHVHGRSSAAATDGNDRHTVASWTASPSPLSASPLDRILSLHYFEDDRTVCLVFARGDIVIVREEPLSGEEDIEIVGTVDAGINAAGWSPDEELLAISTEEGTLLFMTRQFDGAGESVLSPNDLHASTHVSVGWGSSETQFKGKRARALRDPTMPEKIDEGRLSTRDTGIASISWRGDGAFLALSTVHAAKRRVIRVYERNGTRVSTSEPVDGLEGALSWRPAGNLLAGIQRLQDHVDVVFFEQNGLRHGQFDLRIDQEAMNGWASCIHVSWNIDSTVLAISFRDRVQLWTMSNYNYYLKQELHLGPTPTESIPVSVAWSTSSPLSLAISSNGWDSR